MASRLPIVLGADGHHQQQQAADYVPVSGIRYNQSVASQTGFATGTLIVGSSINVPAGSLKIGSRYHCLFNVVKTGAGLVAPIVNVHFGILGTTSDVIRGALTFSAQTAVIDEGMFEIFVTFRVVGTLGIIQTLGRLTHRLSVTGLGVGVSEPEIATSGTFDTAVANSIISVSVNAGLNAAWTMQLVQAQLENLV